MKKWLKKILDWLLVRDRRCECKRPQWHVLIEHYPTYAWDKWTCKRCGACADWPNGEPPAKIKTGICSMGHIHIVN